MYIVIELQTAADGTVANLVYAYQTLNEAYNRYYLILASAAVSELPCHGAVIVRNTCDPVVFSHFIHEQPQPEPNPADSGADDV